MIYVSGSGHGGPAVVGNTDPEGMGVPNPAMRGVPRALLSAPVLVPPKVVCDRVSTLPPLGELPAR